MKKHGFSRLEAILVLSVAALLAAALFPIVAHRRMVQRGELCQTNLKLLGASVWMYAADYNEHFPPVAIDLVAVSLRVQTVNRTTFGWADALEPYTRVRKLTSSPFLCPAEPHPNGDVPPQPGYTHYWLNRNLGGHHYFENQYHEQTLLSGDGDGGSPQSNARYAINALPKSWISTPGSPARRHFDGANYAFADGHVKWLRPQQISNARPDKKHPVHTFAIG